MDIQPNTPIIMYMCGRNITNNELYIPNNLRVSLASNYHLLDVFSRFTLQIFKLILVSKSLHHDTNNGLSLVAWCVQTVGWLCRSSEIFGEEDLGDEAYERGQKTIPLLQQRDEEHKKKTARSLKIFQMNDKQTRACTGHTRRHVAELFRLTGNP